jgi:hypothetical protein
MQHLSRRTVISGITALALTIVVGCGDDEEGVASPEDARRAYLGLDQMIDKAINLGMDGYNAASNANIPQQSGSGAATGQITVDGKVDQGASANKEMDLQVALTDYSDVLVDGEFDIRYDTGSTGALTLGMSLRNIPDGTFNGTLTGSVTMAGALAGPVSLNLSLDGNIESDGNGGIRRQAGSTRITGTASSDFGVYNVDITR